ncbi:unnamed protein product, partial [Effrenium voratum]
MNADPPQDGSAKNDASPELMALEEEPEEAAPARQKEEEETTKPKPPMASICKMFSMMNCTEALVLLVGTLGAVGNGVAQPLLCIVFGDLIDSMGTNTV